MIKNFAFGNYRVPLIGGMLLLLGGCAMELPPRPLVQTPEFSSRPITTLPAKQAVVTAHPLATRAALKMLDQGGSPIDAAIAAQMVLGLVEPQSSGCLLYTSPSPRD